jgi:periplasmic divalent cation tolerance protein
MLMVLVTCASEKEAIAVSRDLVGKKLAICSNLFPVRSIYRWKGKIEADEEYLVMLKTLPSHFNTIVSAIRNIHSYELPVIHAHEEKTTEDVESWLKEELT